MRMRARGFTLIELLVGIAVLAILLAVAVPSFTAFRQRTALSGAAEQLVEGLRGSGRGTHQGVPSGSV